MVCGQCKIVSEVTVKTDSLGDWWTEWCRVDGVTTTEKGAFRSVAQTKMKSTTLSAEVSIKLPMIKSLEAKVGWQVSKSVG